MKKFISVLGALIVMAGAAVAQTAAYVNTETILSKIPEYSQAQQRLERMKNQYETQIENEIKAIENLFNQYQSQKARLNEVERDMRENEIIRKERAVKERQKEIFGQDGVLANESKKLLDPIKDVVQEAINSVAKGAGIVLVFDLAATQGVVFSDPRGDLTYMVLKKLNLN